MRDFSEFEKGIIKRIVSERDNKEFSIAVDIIIQEMEKVDIIAIEWDKDYTYANFYGTDDRKSYTKVLDVISLLKFLEENRFINVHMRDLDVNYSLFSHERYTKSGEFYWHRDGSTNTLITSYMNFTKMHTNIGREIQQISKGIIYVSFALEDLVKNNFETIEQKQLIEAKRQTSYSRGALYASLLALILSLVSTIFTTCADTKIDNKQFNQIIQSIEKQPLQKK
jgi:hypothetical protein